MISHKSLLLVFGLLLSIPNGLKSVLVQTNERICTATTQKHYHDQGKITATGHGVGLGLTVMTYNLWNFNDGQDWDRRSQMLAKYIREEDPDFICLNEIRQKIVPYDDNCGQSSQDDSMFERMSDLLGPQYSGEYAVAMKYPDIGVEEGIAFFTKMEYGPITVRHLRHDYEHPTDGNRRAIIHVPIKLEVGSLHLVLAHWSYQLYDQKFNARNSLDFLEELGLKPDDPIVFMGDLNVISNSTTDLEPVNLLVQSKYHFQDSWRENEEMGFTYCNCKTEPTPSCVLGNRADRILHTQSIVTYETKTGGAHQSGNLCPSDHRFVSTKLAAKKPIRPFILDRISIT